MKTIEKCFKVLDKISFILSALCVGGMLICVFLQVVARIFQFSINWTTEMSQYFFLWSTTFASYVAARRGKLIGVELVQKKFPWPVSAQTFPIAAIPRPFWTTIPPERLPPGS